MPTIQRKPVPRSPATGLTCALLSLALLLTSTSLQAQGPATEEEEEPTGPEEQSAQTPASAQPTTPSEPLHVLRAPALEVTHGVAAGEAQGDAILIWSRANRAATMHVVVSGPGRPIKRSQPVVAARDFTGKVRLRALQPNKLYRYAVWFEEGSGPSLAKSQLVSGRFHSAPTKSDDAALRFAWGGDLAGQNVCRDRKRGFPIFEQIKAERYKFFIALGDMIYSDNTCRKKGRFGNKQLPGLQRSANTLQEYWFAWKYNRGDEGYRRLLANTSIFSIWDDHEVVNDFGPQLDMRNRKLMGKRRRVRLMPLGLRAFLDYNPLPEDPRRPGQLYRKLRWGKHVEIFVLDTRQYRDQNWRKDTSPQPKTMLGPRQRQWLIEGLKRSTATWKLVISSVPMSIPTGSYARVRGHDGWADWRNKTGFERELRGLMTELAQANVKNNIWLTTDVHFAAVYQYTPFAQQHPDFQIHEFVVGPLSANFFPNRAYDRSLGTRRLHFYGPRSWRSVKTFEQAIGWMNFGEVEVDKDGSLRVRCINGRGKEVWAVSLKPK